MKEERCYLPDGSIRIEKSRKIMLTAAH